MVLLRLAAELPTLSRRREDIPLLFDHFIGRFNRLQGKDVVGVSEEVLALLTSHDFPGNARELENIIEHAFVLRGGGLIRLQHLPPEVRHGLEVPSIQSRPGTTLRDMEALHISLALHRHGGNRKAAAEELGIHPSTPFRKIKEFGIHPPSRDGRSRTR